MEQNLVVLQGKIFTVDIQSMFGSTNYGWCMTSLPPEFIFLATENVSSGRMSPVTQRFYFGAVSSEAINVDISFALICWSDFTQVADTYTAHVRIVPSDSGSYTPYSENANMKYGYPCSNVPSLKYGYPCQQMDTANTAMPYGMIYNGGTPQNTPFFANNIAANTPFFANNAAGNTPFFANNAAGNTPIFSGNIPALKYGFPGCC